MRPGFIGHVTMPVVSKAQNAAMHAAEQGKSTLGIPQSVGAEFVADQKPGSVKKLPKRVKAPKSMVRRGRISSEAADKYGGKDQQGINASTR
jgi:hypothetical protein